MAAPNTKVSASDVDHRVLATAKQILKSINTPKEVREDMLFILSTFDNRLSSISSLIDSDDSQIKHDKLDAAEKLILSSDPNSDGSRRSLNWEDSPDEAAEYLSAVDDILQLLENLSIGSDSTEIVDRAENAIQTAMCRLETEFRHILIQSTVPLDADRLYGSIRRVNLSFASNYSEIDYDFESFGEESRSSGRFHERGATIGEDSWVDLIHPDATVDLSEIADRMIRSGYEKECIQVYNTVRRDAMDECLAILGVERLSIEEVHKSDWKFLDEKMKKWIQAVKITVRVILDCEKRLCDQILNGANESKNICFNETAKGCAMQLLNFGEAVAIGKRSPEKLFRILDMYDALAGVLPNLEAMVSDEFLIGEVHEVLSGLGEAATGTFVEFENAILSENSKKMMQNAEIHPLIRYVMNYVRLLVDYSKTMNTLLEDEEVQDTHNANDHDDNLQLESTSPLAHRLLKLLSSLESNLVEKSKLYEDVAMQFIFLMNNILYIVKKVKDSELVQLLGHHWLRKHSGQIRQYETSYLRASWSKVLSCLKDEGIGGSTNHASKASLKEKFKNFNVGFEDICRVQTTWKVSDSQLRDELIISISEKVIPAYRSFLGRFRNQLEGGRNSGKYIKYTSEDLENSLSNLFEGSPAVAHPLRRKGTSKKSILEKV